MSETKPGQQGVHDHQEHLRDEQEHLHWNVEHMRALAVLRRTEAQLYELEAEIASHRAEIARHEEFLAHGADHQPAPPARDHFEAHHQHDAARSRHARLMAAIQILEQAL